jgi:hypothetical protein
MRPFLVTWWGVVALSCLTAMLAEGQPTPLAITTPKAQRAIVGTPFKLQLSSQGGVAPYSWKLLQIQLPAGLRLDSKANAITGVPAVSGEFRIPIAVTDSSNPAQEVQGEIVLSIVAALDVKWKQKPQVRDGGIFGSVVVTNNTGRMLQLTVIVLAVNEVNKAFALGYQHFDFKPQSESPVIPIGSTLPFGTYVIHADAIAEDQPSDRIYRARLQTSQHFKLQQR